MGEYVWTDITIGGKVSAAVAAELRELLDDQFGDLAADITPAGHLYAGGTRNYGNADEVEDFCQENGLPYVLTWEDGGEFGCGSHAWRPGMEEAAEFDAAKDGNPSVPLRELTRDLKAGKTLAEVIDALQIGDAATLPPYIEEAGEETTDDVPVEEPAPASPPSVADVLARAESFIAGFEDDDTQAGIPELLRDLRAVREAREV